MSFEWEFVRLGDYCSKIGSGATPTGGKEAYLDKGEYSLIRSQNIYNNGFTPNGLAFISPEQAKKLDNVSVIEDDILLNITGDSVARVCLAPSKYLPARVNQHVAIIRPLPKIFDSKYVRYFLASPYQQNIMLGLAAIGATRNALTKAMIENFKIPLPPLPIQKEIASILSSLDNRISLLRETNTTLEAIAQTLFKSWFVDFDPVKAKAQGKQPEGMDEATAALFPSEFEESALGLIPKGWRVESIGDVMDYKEGPGIRNWQYTNSDEGTKFINIRCIQDGDLRLDSANRITNEEANGKYIHFHLKVWDVVVSTSGTLGRSAIVRSEHLPLMLNTSVIRFRPIPERMDFCFLYQYVNSSYFLFELNAMASGSVQKNFGPMHLRQMSLICPPFELISRYETICKPLLQKVIDNRGQIQTLTTLRDTLLPRLISGQLRINQAQDLINEVGA